MTSSERLDAVISGTVPDRVPLAPLLDHWAAIHSGISVYDLMTDPDKRIRAILKTASDFKWDMTFLADTANETLLRIGVAARLKMPGVDLPANCAHQFEETGFMQVSDYALLETQGVVPFFLAIVGRIYPEMTMERALADLARVTEEIKEHGRLLRQSGIEPAVGFVIPGCSFEYFSLARGISEGLLDLRRHPETMRKAGKRYCADMLAMAISAIVQNGIQRVFVGLSRSSPVFVSTKHFETIILPEIEYIVNGFVNAGITPVLHCDTDWTKFLPYFQKFPAGKCILELDGFTDIKAAKEILGKRMAIMGDVPSTLTANGTKDEVLDYCRNLIKTVGVGGGFILSTGCSIPVNAKEENILALTEAVEEWGWYQ
jgi:hypothetical protein